MDTVRGKGGAAGALSHSELRTIVGETVAPLPKMEKVLLLHPDYSRHDFTEVLIPIIYEALKGKGLKLLDTLNAAGTHRPMSGAELSKKLGVSKETHPLLGSMLNHHFDDPRELVHVCDIPAAFVEAKTGGHLREPLSVTVNKVLTADYDAIFAVSGTVPHEATGYSGGTKIFFPGVSGPEVTGLFHWAAVLIGIPSIIGCIDNPARDVVNECARHIFELMGARPVVSFDMVYSENEKHEVLPKALFTGTGFEGFRGALKRAAEVSSAAHIVYIDEPKRVIVQRIPEMYDEVWTAGKGSYKLQRPGVLAEGGEIILYAPHIHCFHSNARMDAEIRQIGYHGREFVSRYCEEHPGFDKNVASHVINVRGLGSMKDGQERFPFRVTLATSIPEEQCRAANLGYRDPASLRREDFQGPGMLWIDEGGQWLYDRKR